MTAPADRDRTRQLKRDRARRSARLCRKGGAVLKFRVPSIGTLGDALADAGRLAEWDAENKAAVAAAIAALVCEELGYPTRVLARQQGEDREVLLFEAADSSTEENDQSHDT
jgi:hypothetical protein